MKYQTNELAECLREISQTKNIALLDFKSKIEEELNKRSKSKFIKASDEYLSKLTYDDIYIRLLKEDDEHYYKGMYGMFEKRTNKLLRRHTDTGFLCVPK